ncbi:MAG: efflux RND transporter periplasmic adaptor subunit [Parcubacteria group bacterium]
MKEKIKLAINAVRRFMKAHKVISIMIALAVVIAVIVIVKLVSQGKNETKYVLAAAIKDNISSSVSGSGTVIAESQVDIKPKVSGDVVYVGVKVGDKVEKGQLIARIDDENAAKAVRDAELNLENARLSYEKTTRATEDSLNREIINSRDSVSSSLVAMSDTISDLDDLMYENDRGYSYMTNFNYYKSLTQNSRDKASSAALLADENYLNAVSLYKSASAKVVLQGDDHDELLSSLASSYNLVKAVFDTAESARVFLTVVRDDFNNRNETVPASITEDLRTVDGYISALNSRLSELSARKSALRDALDPLTAKISLTQRENALTDAKEKLGDYYIRAPFDGTVAKMNIKNADSVSSDSVSSGSSIATIVTDKSIAEISLNEVDVAKVKTGEKAVLDFDAVDNVTITGIVTEVDAVGSSSQGVVTYGAKIAFDVENEQIRSGMNVNATIFTETKANILLVPASAVKTQGGKSYVSVVKNPPSKLASVAVALSTVPENVPVTIGIQNDDYVEIISGLNEGDVVIERTVSGNSSSASRASESASGSNRNVMMFGSNGGSAPRMR